MENPNLKSMSAPGANLVSGVLTNLPPAERRSLEHALTLSRIPRRRQILGRSQQCPGLIFILQGAVVIGRTTDTREPVILARLEAGDVVGEQQLFASGVGAVDVVAVTDCLIGVLRPEQLPSIFSECPGLQLALLKNLAIKLGRMMEHAVLLSSEDVTSRLVRTLHNLAKPGPEGSRIYERPTHAALAAMIGTSREVVSRALKLLEQSGEIQVSGRMIQLREK